MSLTTEYVFDPLDPSRLLCVIIRTGEPEAKQGATFLTPPELPLQIAVIKHYAGEQVQPHSHPPVERTMRGTPEALVVLSGSYRMTVLDDYGAEVTTVTLGEGDMVVAVAGGHGFVALEADCTMYEVKVGPYLGADDKVRY